MTTVIVIGVVTAIAMFAILAKMFAGEPEGTEKLQKADIIKQLLALSELESGVARSTSVVPPRPHPDNAIRPGKPADTRKSPNSVGAKPNPGAASSATGVTAANPVDVHPSESVKQ